MKDALNTLFWRLKFCFKWSANSLLSYWPSPFVLLLSPHFLPPSITHPLSRSLFLHLSLLQPVVRQCRRRMWQYWREAQRRSPAACRITMDPLSSSRTPAGRHSSSMAHEVCMCVHLWKNLSLCVSDLPFNASWSQKLNPFNTTHHQSHFSVFRSSLSISNKSTLNSQITSELI